MPSLFLIFLFLIAVAFLCRVDFVYYILYVGLGIYGWSLIVTPRLLRRVHVSRAYNDHAFLNEPVEVQVQFNNDKWWGVPWVEAHESVPPNLHTGMSLHQAFTLRGRSLHTLQYQVRANRRGYYRLGPLQVQAGDLFGITSKKWELPPDYLTVYPRIIPLVRLTIPSRLPFGTIASRQRLFEDPARPQGIRAYRPGDSQRQIHWKATAHTGSLVVKTYQPAISLETAILLNLNEADYWRQTRTGMIEWGIEVAASLAVHLVEQRQAVGLITNGVDPLRPQPDDAAAQFDENTGRLLTEKKRTGLPMPLPPRRGREHLMKLLELLARVEAGENPSFSQWLPKATLGLSWGATLLIITPQGDLAICNALHRLVRAGFNPVLLVLEPDVQFVQVRERGRQLGFAAYHVQEKQNLALGSQPQPRPQPFSGY